MTNHVYRDVTKNYYDSSKVLTHSGLIEINAQYTK